MCVSYNYYYNNLWTLYRLLSPVLCGLLFPIQFSKALENMKTCSDNKSNWFSGNVLMSSLRDISQVAICSNSCCTCDNLTTDRKRRYNAVAQFFLQLLGKSVFATLLRRICPNVAKNVIVKLLQQRLQ